MKNRLLNWYDNHKRPMPWRVNTNPYRVWISEVMLQQTQISTVIPYYERWMNQFPSIETVAKANIDDILKLWEGLGYYRRAHNIKKAAEIIVNELEGQFPSGEQLKKLPGIGDYIYSAITSIAFNSPIPVIDGNVKRFSSRFWEENFITGFLSSVKQKMESKRK